MISPNSIAKLQIEPTERPLIWKSGMHYIHVLVCGLWFVCWLQRMADTNGTLAFEDAQVIPPFFMEETFIILFSSSIFVIGTGFGFVWLLEMEFHM